jgi:predicted GIY-YIG superfamily endonuclease
LSSRKAARAAYPGPLVFAVYIMTNRKRGVLYTGVTSNPIYRASQHRDRAFDGFTKTYNLKRLVWYRLYGEALAAIALMRHDLTGPLSPLQGR